MIKNKLSITNQLELAREEEVITKRKALKLFDQEIIYEFEVGTIKGLQQIHQYLFEDIYFFAGKIRDTNISKGNFRFATTIYLKEILPKIDLMPKNNFDQIIEKYIEMNIAHLFRKGNGRSMRIWLDQIIKRNIKMVID